MLYLTGMQALNIPCSLNTTGDWHQSRMDWEHLNLRESTNSFWGDWGIEGPKQIPGNTGTFYVADHLRALLDMLFDKNFLDAKGLRNDYIGTDQYDDLFFRQIMKMRTLPYWPKIYACMEHEYFFKWVNFERVYSHELRGA